MPSKSNALAKASSKSAKAQTVVKSGNARASQPKVPQLRSSRKKEDELRQADEGFQLARSNAVKYLQTRKQAMFSMARHYHLDTEDLQQEAYEILLTCLRDFNPIYTRAGGEKVTVQFNTFFGNRLESKALEMRNRDPEYQARQAHMADMDDAEREQFRKDPPLLVQHLDHETPVQESLRSEASAAQSARRGHVMMKIAQDSFIEKKLNDLISAERDDKRRAALMHVKVGGVASFEEIAYHFGVTDSRASQILNELMDAFYVQRLIDGDLKSVVYDFRKLNLQEKRARRLLDEAIGNASAQRASQIVEAFAPDYAGLRETLEARGNALPEGEGPVAASENGPVLQARLTDEEDQRFPLQGMEWRVITTLTTLDLDFRPPSRMAPESMPHIRQLAAAPAEEWPPLIITPEGAVIDGERRIHAAAAKGVDRLLCQVRESPSVREAQMLRICMNSRVRPLDKIELYFAIGALLTLGLAQGKIAELLGTSRPNVIVYARVREKASPRLRTLFEDGLIQITNASAAVDLPVAAQDEMADFVRQYGASWGRGPQFAELYEAAAAGQIAQLAPAAAGNGAENIYARPLPEPGSVSSAPVATLVPLGAASAPSGAAAVPPVAVPGSLSPSVANALKRRQEALETALRDADVWAKQREATITQQTSQIQDLRQTVESLKRELEAHALLSQADEATLANYLKEVKHFYGVEERLLASAHHMEKATAQLRSLNLSHRQIIELEGILEKIATAHTALEVYLVNRGGRTSAAKGS